MLTSELPLCSLGLVSGRLTRTGRGETQPLLPNFHSSFSLAPCLPARPVEVSSRSLSRCGGFTLPMFCFCRDNAHITCVHAYVLTASTRFPFLSLSPRQNVKSFLLPLDPNSEGTKDPFTHGKKQPPPLIPLPPPYFPSPPLSKKSKS